MSPPTLSTSQAATYLTERGVSVSDETMRRWADERKVRHLRMPSGQVRFRIADLDAVLAPVEPSPKKAKTA